MQKTLIDEIEKLKGKLSESENSSSVLKKKLEDQEESLENFECLNQTLFLKGYLANTELQDAREEAKNGLQDILTHQTKLGFKLMGEIDVKAFERICSKKFPEEEWEGVCAMLCSKWQAEVLNTSWHPFKSDGTTDKMQINQQDEKLKLLKNELGEDAYVAVTNALLELNEYNPSGGYIVREIWNFKENRRASMKEIVQYAISKLKTRK